MHPTRRAITTSAMGWAALGLAGAAARPLPASLDPAFLRIAQGRFLSGQREAFLKGTNYFGSWRHPSTFPMRGNVDSFTIWSLYHNLDIGDVELDFQFLRATLNATGVRIGTPGQVEFANLVKFHGYEPWYQPDGSITDTYRGQLIALADCAYRNKLRIQVCLLWDLGAEIAADGDAFKPGGVKDRLYARQVASVASALRDHPGVIGYSVGNEVLVRWDINGRQPSWFEPKAAGFVLRRLREVRATAPSQLVTLDENAAPYDERWFSPGMHFQLMEDVDGSNGGKPFRLVDEVDYLAPHFYPETLRAGDSAAQKDAKIADSAFRLRKYMDAAAPLGKPVVFGEFGLKLEPWSLTEAEYGDFRDRLYEQVLAAAQQSGMKGLLTWLALPEARLRPGQFRVQPSALNRFSPVEVDTNLPDGHVSRTLALRPSFSLFDWGASGDAPTPTRAAIALAGAWGGTK